MEWINEVGKYDVTIEKPYIEAMDAKEGDDRRFCVVLPVVTADGLRGFHRKYFTSTVRGDGRYQHEVAAEECEQLGTDTPFDPSMINQLDGKAAQAVAVEDNYKGETKIKIAYLNPRRDKMDPSDASAMFRAMKQGAKPSGTAFENPDDSMPF